MLEKEDHDQLGQAASNRAEAKAEAEKIVAENDARAGRSYRLLGEIARRIDNDEWFIDTVKHSHDSRTERQEMEHWLDQLEELFPSKETDNKEIARLKWQVAELEKAYDDEKRRYDELWNEAEKTAALWKAADKDCSQLSRQLKEARADLQANQSRAMQLEASTQRLHKENAQLDADLRKAHSELETVDKRCIDLMTLLEKTTVAKEQSERHAENWLDLVEAFRADGKCLQRHGGELKWEEIEGHHDDRDEAGQ